ncbi:MAG: hypothetical protein LBM69_04215 [Lachnospiraceae bacterium]|jgi:hypothetical protein|nr:hypothetical protein [Lachnospiraceae bacterium]
MDPRTSPFDQVDDDSFDDESWEVHPDQDPYQDSSESDIDEGLSYDFD